MAEDLPQNEQVSFDLASYLKEHSMSYAGKDEQGNVLVQDKVSGEQGTFDLNGLIKEMGEDPKNVAQIEFNTPDEPVNQSPLSIEDRAKLSVGNTKGSLAYLAKNFEGSTITEKDGLLVKKDGAWHKVDASGIGQWKDPWEFAKDVADLSDIVINGVSTAYGAAKGAALGAAAGSAVPVVGTVAGGIAGGVAGATTAGAASGGIRTSLGRIVGTYDATAEEQMADIGLEALLSAGGETLSLGVKPAAQMFSRAIKRVNSAAAEGSLEVLKGTLARTTGAGPQATQVLFDSSDDVLREVGTTLKNTGNVEAGKSVLKQEQIAITNELLEKGRKGLTQKYGSLLDDLMTKADVSDLKINVDEIVDSTVNSLEKDGFGKVVPIVKETMEGISNTGASIAKKSEVTGYKLVPFTEAERFARAQQGLPAEQIANESVDVVNDVLNRIHKMRAINGGQGKAAARSLQQLNSSIGAIVDDVWDNVAPSAQRALGSLQSGSKNGIAGQFAAAKLDAPYSTMQSVYSEFANSVAMARNTLKNESGEALVNKLVSSSGKNETAKGMTRNLVELAGEGADKKFRQIMIKESASKFLPLAPSMGMVQSMAVGGAIAAKSFGAGIPVLAASSPRLVAKGVNKVSMLAPRIAQGTKAVADPLVHYSLEALNAFNKLRGPQMAAALKRPDLMQQFFSLPMQAAQGEIQGTKSLLEQGGVIPAEGQKK